MRKHICRIHKQGMAQVPFGSVAELALRQFLIQPVRPARPTIWKSSSQRIAESTCNSMTTRMFGSPFEKGSRALQDGNCFNPGKLSGRIIALYTGDSTRFPSCHR